MTERLVSRRSGADFEATVARLEAAIAAGGLTMFAKIDHAAGAAEAGMTLRPTLVHIFGNPRGGTPLMLLDQRIGIDLPLRTLTWRDDAGGVWLGYVDPRRIGEDWGLDEAARPTLAALGGLLATLTREAAGN
jgi:uncharacterized protein (DUF302 family)